MPGREPGPDRDDFLPLRDEGCHLRPKCLECDLPTCIFDTNRRGQRDVTDRLKRDNEIRAKYKPELELVLSREYGLRVSTIRLIGRGSGRYAENKYRRNK